MIKGLLKLGLAAIALIVAFNYLEQQIDWKSWFSPVSNAITPKKTSSNSYRVVGVSDGDTFKILKDGKEVRVRLKHIDAPEKKQPFGQRSKQFLSSLCYDKNVQIIGEEELDKYQRLLVEVQLENGTNINQEMVKNGFAWQYKHSTDKEYSQLEKQARQAKRNIWSEENPTPPWEWRRENNVGY